jgi:hypothetical protein
MLQQRYCSVLPKPSFIEYQIPGAILLDHSFVPPIFQTVHALLSTGH